MANKRQREQKRRERKQRQELAKQKGHPRRYGPAWDGLKPWEPVKMGLYEAPRLVPDSLSQAERTAILRQIAQNAEETFQHEYSRLDKWFSKYDALYLLSYCSLYFLSHPEGVDPEVKGRLDFYAYYLEILQAFSLMQERSFLSTPLGNEAGELLDTMGKIGESATFRGLGNLVDLSELESRQHLLLEGIRTQTAVVRNWGYASHMHKVVHDLADNVQTEFAVFYGVDPGRLMDVLLNLVETAQDRVNQHLHRVRHFFHQQSYQKVGEAFLESFPAIDDFQADHLFDAVGRHLDSFKGWLLYLSDLKLSDHLTFTLGEIMDAYGEGADAGAIDSIFVNLSMRFGELGERNREYVFLDNPVWMKPFIEVDQSTYFSAVLGVMPHYLLRILESLIAGVPGLEEEYRSRRARYLEDELEKLFSDSFPSAKIYRGSIWDDEHGTAGENDLTVIVDCVALVVEAKSGLISSPASRGAPERFRRTVRELIEEPAEQANRFISVMKRMQTPRTFQTKGGSTNTIDATGIRYFVPLAVTLEQFGSVSNLKDLAESGISTKSLSDLASVISLTDLMVIFEVLDLQSEKIHYLSRRREIDDHIRWEGDELDILAFYLENGFNIGDVEYTGKHAFGLMMYSKQLDPYFESKAAGVFVARPELALTDWWKSVLQRLDLGKTEHWLDMAILLLSVPFSDQKKFERGFRNLCRRIRRGKVKDPHNWCVLLSGPPQRRYFLGFYPYFDVGQNIRNSIISQILGSQEAKASRGALCIGMDLAEGRLPYSIAAMLALPDLFDTWD